MHTVNSRGRLFGARPGGSSPGGAMKPGNDFGRAGLFLFAMCVA